MSSAVRLALSDMKAAVHTWIKSAAFNPAWLLLSLCVVGVYVPTYVALGRTVWQTDDGSYGPLILFATLFVIWRVRNRLGLVTSPSACLVGILLLALGLLCYVIGRSQAIVQLDSGSPLPVVAASVLILGGWQSLRVMSFPILYLAFCIPLPGLWVVALTESLKVLASGAAEHTLWTMGYPVARTGVMLLIGPYQLLVADACSGLHSVISLAALGLLYLNIVGKRSWLQLSMLIALIIPIALAANVVRIDILALITYYFGDAAGQGFLHETAGMVVFAVALALFLALDLILSSLFRTPKEDIS